MSEHEPGIRMIAENGAHVFRVDDMEPGMECIVFMSRNGSACP